MKDQDIIKAAKTLCTSLYIRFFNLENIDREYRDDILEQAYQLIFDELTEWYDVGFEDGAEMVRESGPHNR